MSYGLNLGWGGTDRGLYSVLGGGAMKVYYKFSPGLI